ncbi:YlcI/YnfO family protein [Rhizobium sp. LjRoot254]|uniref:YlcI/YnfO family protein n=1 Tax=Rhizobium sp. LjRoot254 TaxID=3342297 RepID=UPI003ECE0B3F
MKSASLPSLRVEPELRAAAESVLNKGETLSNFVENSVKAQIEYRRTQREFIARGLASRDDAKRTGVYFDAADVHAELRTMLAAAKAESDQ